MLGKKGLKTGMYYLRTKAAADAIKFTVDQQLLREEQKEIKVFEKRIGVSSKVKEEMKKTSRKESSNFSDSDQSDSENGVLRGRQNSETDKQENLTKQIEDAIICSLKNKDECLSCSS